MTNGTWLLRRLMILAAAMAVLSAALLWWCRSPTAENTGVYFDLSARTQGLDYYVCQCASTTVTDVSDGASRLNPAWECLYGETLDEAKFSFEDLGSPLGPKFKEPASALEEQVVPTHCQAEFSKHVKTF